MLLILISFSSLLCIFFYFKLYVATQFWKKKGIPYVEPCLLFGNLGSIVLRQTTYMQMMKDAYKRFESHRYFGIYHFTTPILVISDIKLIKEIFVKSFDCFPDHPDFVPEFADPFWKRGLVARTGKSWHDMRVVLSPAFTSRKIKAMFHLMVECSEKLVNHLAGESETVTVEMRDIFTRLTNDITASCAFGIKCDSLRDKDNEFYTMGQEAFDFSGWKSIKFFATTLNPIIIKLFRISFVDEKIRNFFKRITKETISYRETTGMVRPDMMHLLMEAQKNRLEYEEDDDSLDLGFASMEESDVIKLDKTKTTPITDEDIAIQSFIFFFGGYDTVSIALCQLAYELAVNVDVQEKLMEEIDATLQKCNGQITYDALVRMQYLDTVTAEILRLWPPAHILNRLCVKQFVIKPTLPHEKEITIEPGTEILIPAYAIHRDQRYFNNPDKFDPERFSDENKANINPNTYLAFGLGPRHCIGNRFALLAIKTIVFHLLRNFQIVPVEKTVIPFEQSKTSHMLRSATGYWFGLKRRTNKLQ